MTALLIDDVARSDIAKLRDWVIAHPVSFAAMQSMAAKTGGGAKNDKGEVLGSVLINFNRTIQVTDYSITYTHETQRDGKVYRHMSVSIIAPGRVPHTVAVELLMAEFGFRNASVRSEDVHIWLESMPSGQKAINVIEQFA